MQIPGLEIYRPFLYISTATKGEKGMQGDRGLPGKAQSYRTPLNPSLTQHSHILIMLISISVSFKGTSSNLDLYAFKVRV